MKNKICLFFLVILQINWSLKEKKIKNFCAHNDFKNSKPTLRDYTYLHICISLSGFFSKYLKFFYAHILGHIQYFVI